MKRLLPRLSWLVPLVAVSACRNEAPTDQGMIRPEISALPPEARPAARAPGEGWNTQQIDWQRYDAGLAKAQAEHKPVCLVFYTSWCPHCKNYSHVFEAPQVVDEARKFVMIRANADEEHDLAARYQKDGGYVPRTFFLAPDGTLDADIHAPRDKFLYFFDERDPRSLLAGMETALRKLVR